MYVIIYIFIPFLSSKEFSLINKYIHSCGFTFYTYVNQVNDVNQDICLTYEFSDNLIIFSLLL